MDLADNAHTTSVFYPSTMIQDVAYNPVLEITNISVRALAIHGFVSDTSLASLVGFDIDVSNGTLILEFTDVVRSESLKTFAITLLSQSRSNSTSYQLVYNATSINPTILAPADATRDYYNLVPQLGGPPPGLAAPNDDYKITFTLEKRDLDNVKILTDLATSVYDTFILTTEDVALDIYGRNVIAPLEFLQTRSFYPDYVRPNLIASTLNLTSSIAKFSFDEPVNPLSLIVSKIIFQNAASSTVQYRLSDSAYSGATIGSLEVELALGYRDSNALQSISNLAKNLSTTYLSLDSGALADQNGNPTNPIPASSAIQANRFTPDTTRPYLISFDLNLNDNYLSLYFNEAVNPSTFGISLITLQNTRNINESTFTHTLPSSLVYTRSYDGLVFITLTDMDQLLFKSIYTPFAKTKNNTYISFPEHIIRNYQNLYVEPVSPYNAREVRNLMEDLTCYATQAAEYIPDSTPPILEAFEIDLNTGQLELFFNETVNHSSVYLPAVTLLDAATSPQHQYQLKLNGEVFSPRNSENLTMLISPEDLIFIKDNPSLFVTTGSSQLSFSRMFIRDMSDNSIDAVDFAGAIQARVFQRDSFGPLLVGFSLDLDSGLVNLTFNEPINVLNFNPDSITIQNAVILASQNFTLTGNQGPISVNSPTTILSFTMESQDLLILKSIPDLATSVNDTFLTHTDALIRDKSPPSGNSISAISVGIRVTDILSDTTRPNLVSFPFLDFNVNQLVIYFDEPMNTSSLLPEHLTFHASQGGPLSIPLTGGTFVSSSDLDRSVVIEFNEADIFSFKNDSNIATLPSNTFISTTSQLIRDTTGNRVNTILPATALQYSFFTVIPDSTGPLATDCNLDLDTRMLSLTFDDPIDPLSLILSKITLHRTSDGTSPDDSYEFQDTVISSSPRGYSLDVGITIRDFNGIKVETFVAVDENTTHISMLADTVQDLSNNPSRPILSTSALTCSQYTPDKAAPYVTSWTLDMDATPTLTIDFSETMQLDSLQLDNAPITLVGLYGQLFNLTGGEFNKAPNAPQVVVSLTIGDTNAVKELLSLATYIGDTFLAIIAGAMLDLDGNPLQQINVSSPLQALIFTPDTTNPNLLYFNIDMDAGRIWLTFDEVVNGSTLIPSLIGIQHSIQPDPPLYSLTGGYFPSGFSTVTYLNITTSDLNEIKRLEGLAVSNLTTYLTLREGAIIDVISDFSSNPVNEIFNTNPRKVTTFIPDRTNPIFFKFSLNLTSETLSLTFDETVSQFHLLLIILYI